MGSAVGLTDKIVARNPGLHCQSSRSAGLAGCPLLARMLTGSLGQSVDPTNKIPASHPWLQAWQATAGQNARQGFWA